MSLPARAPPPASFSGASSSAPPLSMSATQPLVPPRSRLRIDTSLPLPSPAFASSSALSSARLRSNSHTAARPLSPPQQWHQISRSMSQAPMSSGLSGPGAGAGLGNSMVQQQDGREDVGAAASSSRDVRAVPLARASEVEEIMITPSIGAGGSARAGPSRLPAITSSEGEDAVLSEAGTLRRIQDALARSPDNGDTLDLSRRGIDRIGPAAVEAFMTEAGEERQGVWRLALSYNALRNGSLLPVFSALTRLRYLNLKGNAFTVFPEPLTELPALEILDLSKNRITSFPANPRLLSNLRVLSMTHNKLVMLPAYMAKWEHLKVMKLEGNKIEWPPKEVLGPIMEPYGRSREDGSGSRASQNEEDLRPWIENMKSWMRQRAAETERMLERTGGTPPIGIVHDDQEAAEPTSAVSMTSSWGDFRSMSSTSLVNQSRSIRDEAPRSASPLAMRFEPRNRSNTVSSPLNPMRPASPSVLPSTRTPSKHIRDLSSSSSNAPLSASASSTSGFHSRNPSTSVGSSLASPSSNTPHASGNHTRAGSLSAMHRLSSLSTKTSLPDLRQNHAKIIQERRSEWAEANIPKAAGLGITAPSVTKMQEVFSADMQKAVSSESGVVDLSVRKRSVDMPRGTMDTLLAERRGSQDGPLMDESRNSYFRRLSTLPVSTLSKAIPAALLGFVDAVRGILFALSQLHTALRQFMLYAAGDKTAGVLSRVMEPASLFMMSLINALDRFDSTSRRGTPPVSAIRGVIETTKDCVLIFAKVTAVLKLQMPILRRTDERYARTLLLMVYGSMAEIARSWTTMGGLLERIQPLLSTDSTNPIQRSVGLGSLMMAKSTSFNGRTPISPIPERAESQSPGSVPRGSIPEIDSPMKALTKPVSPVKTREEAKEGKRRRQGGSFSAQDVERGMMMGSPGGDGSGTPAASVPRHKPAESAQIVLTDQEERSEPADEKASEDGDLVPPALPLKSEDSGNGSPVNMPATPPDPVDSMVLPNPPFRRNSRHKQNSSSGSSHGMHMGSMRKPSIDTRLATPMSARAFDDDLLDVIDTATDVGFTVWLKLAEDVGASSPNFVNGHFKSSSSGSIASQVEPRPGYTTEHSRRPTTISQRHHSELLALLSQAEQITSNLRESVLSLRNDPSTYSSTPLPEHAQAFIKIVVRVSQLVQAISASHVFSPSVRMLCSKLTQAARECAILMQVSSLRPVEASKPGYGIPMSTTGSRVNLAGGAMSSSEDLAMPSAPFTAPSFSGGSAGGRRQLPLRDGLRGLQLQGRQGPGRSRSTTNILAEQR